jgi:two-component system, LuxR family, sensor kinase FixL
MKKPESSLNFIRRLLLEDAQVQDPNSKGVIISVLILALIADLLLIILDISAQSLMLYGVLLLVTLFLALRGYLFPARLVIPLGGLIVFTYLMIVNSGIRDIAILGLPAVIIAAGLLFGKLGTLFFGLLSVGVVLFIGIAEKQGAIVNEFSSSNTMDDYLAAIIALMAVTILQWLLITRLNENIRRAQNNEQAEKAANEALRLSEARYRLLIEQSPQGILITDNEGVIVLVNPFGCKLLGYENSELIGKSFLNLMEPEFGPQESLLEGEVRTGKVLQRESILLHRDGSHIHVMGGYRYMPDGRFQYIFQDISERKQAEVEREALIRELESKNAELEQFTYTVSHDLKSPLVTIRGFIGYLEKDIRDGDLERIQSDIARIIASTDKMQVLLRELLELSRVGRVKNPSEILPFNVIVAEALKLVEGQFSSTAFRIDVMADMPDVYGDRLRLIEVVQNLLDNAIKFSSQREDPCIEIGVRKWGHENIFYVYDNGIGIPLAYHERVFGLFNKLDTTAEGTGIGLAIVKRIVEVHGGRIWIESDGSSGTTFCFTLAEGPVVEKKS